MAVLRTEKGDLYTRLEHINRIIAPNKIGSFRIEDSITKLVEKPLDEKGSLAIYQHIPKEMDSYCRSIGLSPTKALTVWEGSNEKVKERVNISTKPHINHGTELHFFFAGSLIFYFNLKQGQVAFVIQAGDWLYIDGATEHWIKNTNDHYFTLASYHSAPLAPVDEFHKLRVFTKTPTPNRIL